MRLLSVLLLYEKANISSEVHYSYDLILRVCGIKLLSEVNLRRHLVPPSTTTLSLKVTIWLDSSLTSNFEVSIIHTGGYRFVSPDIVDGFAWNIKRFKHNIVPSCARSIIIRLLYHTDVNYKSGFCYTTENFNWDFDEGQLIRVHLSSLKLTLILL